MYAVFFNEWIKQFGNNINGGYINVVTTIRILSADIYLKNIRVVLPNSTNLDLFHEAQKHSLRHFQFTLAWSHKITVPE